MQDCNAIEVRNVKKKFRVYFDKGSQLKERLLFKNRNRYEERWVLNGVSFDVKKGEAIGLIGHNGCGKSTTLKLLTRIMYPDSGTIELKGRVSSLIELGAGFHPDMSGRENIYTNAAIFGLSKKEIDARMDDIIAFSEMEPFLDNPVRTYSSGMYMRLAFSVAINVDADILLIDEILAVGDINFQAKCFNKLREIKANGTTIVIVSHAMGQIEQICDRSIWIHDGLIKGEGIPRDIDMEYLNYMGERRDGSIFQQPQEAPEPQPEQDWEEEFEEETPQPAEEAAQPAEEAAQPAGEAAQPAEEAPQPAGEAAQPAEEAPQPAEEAPQPAEEAAQPAEEAPQPAEEAAQPAEEAPQPAEEKPEEKKLQRWGNGKARFVDVHMENSAGERKTVFSSEQPLTICMKYRVKSKVEDAVFGIGIFRSDGLHCYGTNTRIERFDRFDLDKNGEVKVDITQLALLPGQYTLDVAIESDMATPVDYYKAACTFQVYSVMPDVGVARLDHTWQMN